MEQGWTLNHEDLVAAGITVISGVNTAYTGHGTAVLGEILAVDNTIGDMGIAPNVTARVVSQWRSGGTYNTAEAILSAASAMSSGDVLLLEAQTSYPTASGYVPVEVEQAVFDAIQYATSQGIIVVEAGANGSVDLDAFQDVSGKFILNRSNADFRDSGAIIVGAASSAAPHTRLSFSNYGSRIDCYAWGENIDSTGDGWTGTATNLYTTSFGGTSGATPIVTGSALIVQSSKVAQGQPRLTPSEMRALLSDSTWNTASANPAADRIGVMPNLQAIIGSSWPWNRWIYYLAWAWMIMIGGWLITPGGGWCIKCGPGNPNYIGDTFVNILGIVAIALGVIGLVGAIRANSAAGTR
jgi:subtilisin family serine protease